MLRITDLHKEFRSDGKSVSILNGVSFEIEAGLFFTLLGSSGCGKTTTMRCVAGLETPDAGTIEIANQVVWTKGPNGQVYDMPTNKRPIAMVFQSYAIWPHMNVFDNAAFPLRHGRKKIRNKKIVQERVESILDRVGLGSYTKRMATDLSGGQQQRLALARALVDEPELLLLDEPLSNLDAKLRVTLRSELKALQSQSGVTTLYVTHDQGEALAMSDLIAVMDAGRLMQIDTPRNIYEGPTSSSVAGVVGDVNTLSGDVNPSTSTFAGPIGTLCCDVPAEVAGPTALCIRPEDIEVQPGERLPEEENWFIGMVLRTEFLGSHVHAAIQVGEETLSVNMNEHAEMGVGARVLVHIPRSVLTIVSQ